LRAQIIILPRPAVGDAAGGDVYECAAAALRAVAVAGAPDGARVAAAVHRGTARLEADWLWDASEASTIRILPAGPGVDALRELGARAAAGAVRVSATAARGEDWDAVAWRTRLVRVPTGGAGTSDGGGAARGESDVVLVPQSAAAPRLLTPSAGAHVQSQMHISVSAREALTRPVLPSLP
jgi:hypothetical protein